jgi:hypothetical protein
LIKYTQGQMQMAPVTGSIGTPRRPQSQASGLSI